MHFNYPILRNDDFTRVVINHSDYPNNTSAWFYEANAFEYKDLKKLKTKYSVDMSLMFSNAFRAVDNNGNEIRMNLDLSHFDTSNVTSMAGMFMGAAGSYKVTSINLSSFDTSQVTNMCSMFEAFTSSKYGIQTLDLSSYNTTNVTNMSRMFYQGGFNNMTTLKLGNNFDTSKVTDMSYMFRYCGAQK